MNASPPQEPSQRLSFQQEPVSGANAAAQGSASQRIAQVLAQSRLVSDANAHHIILKLPSDVPDMAAVQRRCSMATPSGMEEVVLYHCPDSEQQSGRRKIVAVSIAQSIGPSSVAMDLIKKRLADWEDEVNCSATADDAVPAISGGDCGSGRPHISPSKLATIRNSVSTVESNVTSGNGGTGQSLQDPQSTQQPGPHHLQQPGQCGNNAQRPTLFNLLEALASDNVTTPDQRSCIRGIVTDFLNHDLPHSKVYTFIGAVVGHDVLHSIVRKLENEPGRLGVPDAGGLARIEKAFGLSKTTSSASSQGHPAAGGPASTGHYQTAPGLSSSNLPHRNAAAAFQRSGSSVSGILPGVNLTNRDDILRAIRRNLDSRRMLPPQSTKDVFDKVRWLPVRRPLTPVPVFGHTLISFSNKAIFFGGSNERGEGVSFRSACVINLNFFSSRLFVFCGDYPCERDGHTTNGLTLQHSPGVILFGGLAKDRFLNDVYVLELDFKRWVQRHPSGLCPLPRDQHAASVFPAKTETGNWRDNNAENLSEFLFIFGGRTGNPQSGSVQCVNDMWALHLPSNTWTEVQIGGVKPAPRSGFCMIWSEDLHLSLFGGEGQEPGGRLTGKNRILLDDFWHFKIKDIVNDVHSGPVVVGEWQQEVYEGKIGPRSHYASIFITQRYQEPRAEPRTIERLMMITSGVTAVTENGRMRITETDQINVYFFSKKQWYTIKPRYPADYVGEPYGARQRHVACFFETHTALARSSRPPVPCLFIHGGFRRQRVLGDAWVLSLTGDDPYKGVVAPGLPCAVYPSGSSSLHSHMMNQSSAAMRTAPSWYQRDTHTPGILWALCSQQRWLFGAIAQLVDNSIHPSVGSRKIWIRFEETPDKDSMLSIHDDGLGLDYPAMNKLLRLYGNFEPGDRQRKPHEYGCGFKMAYGRIASSSAIMSRTQGTIGIGMLSLELMGHCDAKEMAAPMCMWRLPNKELINRDPNNMADHRHHQRLLMTYTPFTTPSLLAEQINVLGTAPGTRIVFWDLRDDLDYLVCDEQDKMLYLSSAPDVNSHGRSSRSATRPSRASADHQERTLVSGEGGTVNNAPLKNTEVKTEDGDSAGGSNGTSGETEKNMNGVDPSRPNIDETNGTIVAPGPNLLDLDEDGKPLTDTSNPSKEERHCASGKQVDRSDGASGGGGAAEPSSLHDVKAGMATSPYVLPPFFPLWTHSKYSPDYCLATYLFWLQLHSPAITYVQGTPLLPTRIPPRNKTTSEDRDGVSCGSPHQPPSISNSGLAVADGTCGAVAASRPHCTVNERCPSEAIEAMRDGAAPSQSLYVFLKQRLYAAAELSYLFTPADHEAGCFALMGFLNDPNSSYPSTERFCEAGVMLYFRQRLIRKLECTFPDTPKSIDAASLPPSDRLFGGPDNAPPHICRYAFTAVVNVPEWMLPALNKQEFLHENNKPYMKFKARFMKIMQDYLQRCRNHKALTEWLDQRAKRLREFQDHQRRMRPKRRLAEELMDEEQPRRSPTPPITHSTSGAPIWTGQRGGTGVTDSGLEPAAVPANAGGPTAVAGVLSPSNDSDPVVEEAPAVPIMKDNLSNDGGDEAESADKGTDQTVSTNMEQDGTKVDGLDQDVQEAPDVDGNAKNTENGGVGDESWCQGGITRQ